MKTAIWMICVTVACSSAQKTYVSYSDWDSNGDQKIDRKEFVDAYIAQDYFKKWAAGASSMKPEDLFNEAFESIDSDGDQKLSLVEFNSQIKLFYFGLFRDTFDRWDDDSNASISQMEFSKHVANTDLVKLWDTDGSNRITEREMAGGMFYICDADSDGNISEVELDTWKRNRNRSPGNGSKR